MVNEYSPRIIGLDDSLKKNWRLEDDIREALDPLKWYHIVKWPNNKIAEYFGLRSFNEIHAQKSIHHLRSDLDLSLVCLQFLKKKFNPSFVIDCNYHFGLEFRFRYFHIDFYERDIRLSMSYGSKGSYAGVHILPSSLFRKNDSLYDVLIKYDLIFLIPDRSYFVKLLCEANS